MSQKRRMKLQGQFQERGHPESTRAQHCQRTSLGCRCWLGKSSQPQINGFQVQHLLGKAGAAACGRAGFRWFWSIIIGQVVGKSSRWEPCRIQYEKTGSLWTDNLLRMSAGQSRKCKVHDAKQEDWQGAAAQVP